VRIGLELERDGIHAVPLTGWRGTVVEQMSEVTLTATADNFCALHAVRIVCMVNYTVRAQSLEEAWPSTGT